jgi:hypothetical protein
LTTSVLKGTRIRHGVDPHKDLGLEPSPAQRKSIYFKRHPEGCHNCLADGVPVDIFIEVESEQKKFGKKDIEYKLYKKEVQIQKVYYLCFKNGNKVKKIDTRKIIGFMFGGISSRFWLEKNFINLMEIWLDLPPEMLCWNMISIMMTLDKSINLIITSSKDMNILIQFLIEQNYKNQEYNELQEIKRFKFKLSEQDLVAENFIRKIHKRAPPSIRKDLLYYKIMRIRMKLSYHAWKRHITVKEMIMR